MEENLSEFLKNAYKKNRVKDLKEAFEEYPPEEEWHKGKVENVVMDINESYNYYNIGDIVFVNEYRYSNGKVGNNHLFVIIDQNNMAVPIENLYSIGDGGGLTTGLMMASCSGVQMARILDSKL